MLNLVAFEQFLILGGGKREEKETSKELCEVFFSSAAVEEARELVAAADFIKLQVDELPRDMRNHKQLKEILKDTSRKIPLWVIQWF